MAGALAGLNSIATAMWEDLMDSSTFALVELVAFYGLFFAFCLHQIYSLKRDSRKSTAQDTRKIDQENPTGVHWLLRK